MSFKVGDTVQLKLAGSDMTVIKTGLAGGEPMVWCAWFEGTKGAHGLFAPEALKMPLGSILRWLADISSAAQFHRSGGFS